MPNTKRLKEGGTSLDDDETDNPQSSDEHFKIKATRYLQRSQYQTLFRFLCETSKAAKHAMMTVVENEIKKEICTVKKPKHHINTLCGAANLATISTFHWKDVLQETQSKCPWLFSMLSACFPPPHVMQKYHYTGTKKNQCRVTIGEANSIRCSRLGVQLAVILHSNSPRIFKAWQSMFGVELWRQTATQATFRILSLLGLCQSQKAAISQVDSISMGFDRDLKMWKKNVEGVGEEKRSLRRKLNYESLNTTFSFCWDNVQWEGHRHHHNAHKHNEMHLKALAFALQHRIPSMQYENTDSTTCSSLDPQCFLPSNDDWNMLKERMIIIVQRILSTHMNCLQNVKVTRHVPHQYSQLMSGKTNIVNLGVYHENPASHEGVRAIVESLQKYCPIRNGQMDTIICNGDGLSVDRMRFAKERRCRAPSQEGRLEGLIPNPQEFHKEAIILQDTMNHFFSEKTQAIPGTLYHMKQYFNHKSVSRKVLDNYQHVFDLIQFAAEALTTTLAMQQMQIMSLDQTPHKMPKNPKNHNEWLQSIATTMVNFIWKQPPDEDIQQIKEGAKTSRLPPNECDEYPYCFCKEEIGGPMVECCNAKCDGGWFHFECVTPVLTSKPDDDWYCSQKCRRARSYIYCLCKKHKAKEDNVMVTCELDENCRKSQWYHPSCLGLDVSELPDIWYCSPECQEIVACDDDILTHSKDLLFQCLTHLAKKDMVREGDGPAIMAMWRVDNLNFWSRGHTHYKILTHMLLAYTSGVAPDRIQHELTWERVANVRGIPGGNVGIDLINEFLNNDFKEMIKRSRGNYTNKQIARCSKLGGAFGKEIDRILSTAITGESPTTYERSGRKQDFFKDDVKVFVDEFQQEQLFTYRTGRTNPNLPPPVSWHVKRPHMFGEFLKRRSKAMDMWMRVAKQTKIRVQNT